MHPLYERANALSADVFDAVLEVKRHFGMGVLLEKVYQKCLAKELELRGHKADLETAVPITYKGYTFEEKLRVDILVDDLLIVFGTDQTGKRGISRVILKGADAI